MIDTRSDGPARAPGGRASGRIVALLVLIAAGAPRAAVAQQGTPAATSRLSLEDALRLAESRSEAVQIARAGATRARGQLLQARSQLYPQLSGVASYQRTLRSQFQALGGGGGGSDSASQGPPPPPALCAPRIPENATPEQRAAALAQASTCPASGGAFGGIDFSRVGFGARNQWVLGLSLSQNLWTGGRVESQIRASQAGERVAALDVAQQRAQLALDVSQAYYDAALASRLVSIAEATLGQTEDVLRQTRVARQVGNTSEFELLRAQVTRDNQRPVLIQARANRETAFLRLKQLLDLPLEQPVELTTAIEDAATPQSIPTVLAAARLTPTGTVAAPDTTTSDRAVVRQLAENVRAQELLERVTRSQRFPSVSLTTNYQRLFFPSNFLPAFSQFSENWTVGVSAGVSLFNGGRLRGEALVARANVDEARARLDQIRELAALDARIALNALREAESQWQASQGTVEQAQRAVGIDQVRFREGIATQTDLAQTRLLLEQATANRALAARELAVARMRLVLLRDLPLSFGGAGSTGAQGGSQGGASGGGARGAPSQQPSQQQPRTQPQAAGAQAAAAQMGSATP